MISENNHQYLEPDFYMDFDRPEIAEKVAEITAGALNRTKAGIALFNFVRDRIVYNFAPDLEDASEMKASETLKRGNGFCTQKAILLAAVMRSIGIPSGIVFQDLRDYKLTHAYVNYLGSDILKMHGLTKIYVPDHWIRIDATLDAELVERNGYRLTQFDGEHEALFPATDRAGHPHFDVLREYGFSHTLEKDKFDYYWNIFHQKDYSKWKRIVHTKNLSM